MTESARLDVDQGVGAIVLCNPDARNVLSVALADALVEICTRINQDVSIRCVVLCAEGPAFSAGGNIKDMHVRAGHFSGGPAENRRSYLHGVQRIVRAFYDLEAPVIAAVQGPAIGFGFDLALMADIRLASTKAEFAESFVTLGLVSAAGGAWLLNRIAGPAVAAELVLTGKRFDAAQALRYGLVSQVVTPDRLLPSAYEIAAQISALPPHSVRLNKRLLRESAGLGLHAALEHAAAMQAIVQHTEDQREAVAAVIEKRSPKYEGR